MSLDVSYNLDGTVVEVEEGIAAKDLPSSMRQAVKSEYPNGRIDRAERRTVGETVTYEIRMRLGKKRVGMEIDSSGRDLRVSKPSNEDEEKEEED